MRRQAITRGMTRTKSYDPTVLFEAIEVSDYDIGPDGKTAICSVNRGVNWELALLDLKSGKLRKFLAGPQSLMHPVFSPDGDRIAYHVDFEGNENHDIVVIGSNGKRPKRITDGIEDNSSPEFSPDGKTVAFISNRDRDIENLFTVPAAGGRMRKISHEPLPVRGFAWSPDGRYIAYGTGVSENDYISLADTRTGKTRKLLDGKDVEYELSVEGGRPKPWHPDGTRLLYLTNENDATDVAELDLSNGSTRMLVKSKVDKVNAMWSPDGRKLAYKEIQDPDVVVKVREGAKTYTVSPAKGTSRLLRWLPDSRGVVFMTGSSVAPDEFYIARGKRPNRLTRLQARPIPSVMRFEPTLIRYKSFDGLKIPALLYLPKDRSRRAGIVFPHGGPEAQDTNYWDQLAIMLLKKGFVLIKPNYRGSTGYGRRFLHLHDKDLGGGDFKDTVWAGKHLVDSGLVDADRLGYWGASYSGFTCMMALTKYPEMWSAGVSIVGFFDWVTEHASERGYLKAYDEAKMGDFSKNTEFFKERSPINFLQNLRAPLLMTASSRDVRCPPTESRAVVARLKEMGKEPEYHEYKDEGHWPRKRKNLFDLYSRSTRFLDEHIPK